MVLFKVYKGCVSAVKVVRETRTGWREINGGFINKNPLVGRVFLDQTYYTTSLSEATKWSHDIAFEMNHCLMVASASLGDFNHFVSEKDIDEDDLPTSRVIYRKRIY